jgi:adenylosuccinate synthase
MPGIVIVGAQWGDEGKGKATDLIAGRVNYVARYNGGSNAGHTVVVNGKTYALRLMPSGIVNPGVTAVIGNGVAFDPQELVEEKSKLEAEGVDTSHLLISLSAQVTTPYHRLLDRVSESHRGKRKIGTTGRGIGPTYADKVNRVGIRVADLFNEKTLRAKVEQNLALKNELLEKIYDADPVDPDKCVDELLAAAKVIKPYCANTALVLNRALDRGESVLFEGGQATMLDIDHGTYPFVTSSNPTAGGACTGTGVGPTKITRVVGVSKAYVTRVGAGPFPTELDGPEGDWLRDRGHEYGVVTKRPRRCGWFDALVVKYAVMINGLTDLVITKLDTLTGLKKIPICVAYDVTEPDGSTRRVTDMPVDQSEFASAKPVYEEMDGWSENITGITDFDRLPAAAQAYIRRIENLVGCRVSLIGNGPSRSHIIRLHSIVE